MYTEVFISYNILVNQTFNIFGFFCDKVNIIQLFLGLFANPSYITINMTGSIFMSTL